MEYYAMIKMHILEAYVNVCNVILGKSLLKPEYSLWLSF